MMPSEKSLPQGFLRHFYASNQFDQRRFLPFLVAGNRLGWIEKNVAALLQSNSTKPIFLFDQQSVALAPHLDSFEKRSAALTQATDILLRHFNQTLRHEMYPVIAQWGDAPLAQVDRIAVPWFGVRGFGIHVNGFVRRADGLHLWVGERAANRQNDPGKLDNIIGGGQPIGLSLEENLCKEAQEEAGIAPELILTAKAAGSISYILERHSGLRCDTLYVYDLELPDGYTPQNTDGEVAAFHLMPLAQVAEILQQTDRFKFNCSLIVIDFMVRHGFIRPDHPEYAGLQSFLNRS